MCLCCTKIRQIEAHDYSFENCLNAISRGTILLISVCGKNDIC